MALRLTGDFEVWYTDGLGPATAENIATAGGTFEVWYTVGLGPAEITRTVTVVPLPVGPPVLDFQVGGWTTDSGSTVGLYTAVDESTASDTDYIQSSLSPFTLDEVKLTLGPLNTPIATAVPVVQYRYGKDQTSGHQIDLRVRLYAADGTTVIAEQTHTNIGAITDGTFTLTPTQTAAIPTADYLNGLVLGFGATAV